MRFEYSIFDTLLRTSEFSLSIQISKPFRHFQSATSKTFLASRFLAQMSIIE